MATASVTVRVDEDTKRAAANIVEISASISHQSRAFYRQIVREQRIPPHAEYPTPNLESREAIRGNERTHRIGRSGYATVSEMFGGDGSIASAEPIPPSLPERR